jgi:uncharacterized OB-fold protein
LVEALMNPISDTTTLPPPIAPGLFELDDELVLLGTRCRRCATVAFPAQDSCPRCTAQEMADHRLATTGTLWTWTTQGFRPKSPPYSGPEAFTPYAVGYVELGGEIRVEGILCDVEPGDVRNGQAMRTTALVVSGLDAEPRTTYGFAPQGGA